MPTSLSLETGGSSGLAVALFAQDMDVIERQPDGQQMMIEPA